MQPNKNKGGALYRSYGFWVSVAGMALFVVKTVLNSYGIQFEERYLSQIADGLLAVMVVAGVIAAPKKGEDADTTDIDPDSDGE